MKTSLPGKLVIFFNLLLAILIFVLPSHFFLKWGIETAYVRGLLIDYLIPKLYLSDLIMAAIVMVGSWLLRPKLPSRLPPKYLWFGVMSVLLVLLQLTAAYPVPALVMGLRLGLGLSLGWIIVQLRTSIKPGWILSAIVLTLIFQSGLGLYHFFTQHSWAGYWLLGEPTIPRFSGLATASFGGVEKILPYGTTAHPNVLAGVLAVYLTAIISQFSSLRRATLIAQSAWIAAVFLGGLTLLLTHSLSGYVAMTIGLGLLIAHRRHWKLPKNLGWISLCSFVLIPIVIQIISPHLPTNFSLSRRAHLNTIALQLWQQQPLWGVGLTNNAAAGESFSAVQEPVRFAQPTHHLSLLWLSETGMLGLIWLGLLLWMIRPYLAHQQPTWLLLLPIAALDHYLLTTQAGLLLMILLLTGVLLPSKNLNRK